MKDRSNIQQEYCGIYEALKKRDSLVKILPLQTMIGEVKSTLKSHIQHDAAEGLQCLINQLLHNVSVSKSDNLFSFCYTSKVYCNLCHNDGTLKFEEMNIQKYTIIYCILGKSRNEVSIENLFKNTHHIDRISKGPVERICGHCSTKGGSQLLSDITHLPKYMFFACNRSMRYARRISGPSHRSNRPVVISRQMKILNFVYELKGFIIHHGSTTSGGHYTAYVLHSNSLIHYNDSQVEVVDLEEIDSHYIQRNVVLLLYSTSQVEIFALDECEVITALQDSECRLPQVPMDEETPPQDTDNPIQSLTEKSWLNDIIIEKYLNLLINNTFVKQKHNVQAASCCFSTSLVEGGCSKACKYFPKAKFFLQDIILIPWNFTHSHWTLLVVKPKEKLIIYLDSGACSSNMDVENLLWSFVCEQEKNLDQSEWRRCNSKMAGMPVQLNGCDCGMFVCVAARCLVFGELLNFTQMDMPNWRKVLKYELLHECLLGVEEITPLPGTSDDADNVSSHKNDNGSSDSGCQFQQKRLPSEFILPKFTIPEDTNEEESIDIFKFDCRSVKDIWEDTAKNFACESFRSDNECVFQRAFIRKVVKSNEEKWRKLVRGELKSAFSLRPSKSERQKISMGWPIELSDMVFEVETFLKAVQSDEQQKKSVTGLHIATNILWPEAMVHILSERFNISMEQAYDIYITEDITKLYDLIM